MHLITRQEIELIRTLNLSLRATNKDNIINYLRNQYKKNPTDPDIGLNFGLCLTTYALLTPGKPRNKLRQGSEAIKALSVCLEYRDDWWLPRFLRSELLQVIAGGLFDMSTDIKIKNPIAIQPSEDRQILLEQQSACGKDVPYFLCPYISQALSYAYRNHLSEGIKIYKQGVERYNPQKSPVYMLFLIWPFCMAVDFFRKIDLIDMANEIKEIGLILFPDSPSLCSR